MREVKTDLATLKVELLCLGAKVRESIDRGRVGGAGPAGGRYLVLPGGVCVNVPLQGEFTATSPFELLRTPGGWELFKNGKPLVTVGMVGRPSFYSKSTSDKIPMWKVALLHGRDCLASTVYQRCYYWRLGKPCTFCAIEVSANLGLTVDVKRPEQLAEVAAEAAKEGVSHVTLTTGTPPSPDRGALLLARAAQAIKEASRLPVHVQVEPPRDLRYLDLLAKAEVDTIGVHIETFDKEVLALNCPMKADVEAFFKAWRRAVQLFGEAQVSSFIIIGLGERRESVLQGSEYLVRMGVVPYLVPLRPLLGAALAQSSPPPPLEATSLYADVARVMSEYGLDPSKNKAGCVRCGCCSALREFLYTSRGA